jgi:hypothetical protein
MLGFKFVSLPALILLALGTVAQDTYVEPVPLYGQCEFLALLLYGGGFIAHMMLM